MALEGAASGVERTQVLVVGAGPVGLAMAHLLGAAGVETLLIERNDDTVPEPRAIGLDGESLRTLQAAGLADAVVPDLMQGFVSEYYSGDGTLLFSTDLTERPFGFCMQNAFDQPRLERTLLEALENRPGVSARFATTLLHFTQDDTGVSATLQDPEGEPLEVRADYIIGCDGGRSEVRRAIGAIMEGDRLPQKWLVIDTVSPRHDALPQCRFFCDPARPAMTLQRPHGERRWEWMLMPGEQDEELLDDHRIQSLLAEHVDPEGIEVYRKCVYGFSAVVADRFHQGRAFLAGDAAHMTPPFAGQGLNSGVRDVRNLAWKLAAVLDGRLPATLLDTYQTERHDHAQAMVDLAVGLGERIQPTDPAAAAERDAMFAAINADPEKAAAFHANSAAALREARLDAGWFAQDASLAGQMLHQPRLADGRLLDDLIGAGAAALCCGGIRCGSSLRAHPLWQALAPVEIDLLAEGLGAGDLDQRVDITLPAILLLRPDRFLLATLPEDEASARSILDGLLAAL